MLGFFALLTNSMMVVDIFMQPLLCVGLKCSHILPNYAYFFSSDAFRIFFFLTEIK